MAKKTVCVSGRVMLPIKEGARAVISCGGGFVYTSRVVEIFEVSENMAHFETMNSIYKVLQVAVYKWRRKRLFRMAPLHHHFEKGGWSEWRIVGVFSLAAVLAAVAGLPILL